jgi:hypothetical protein
MAADFIFINNLMPAENQKRWLYKKLSLQGAQS